MKRFSPTLLLAIYILIAVKPVLPWARYALNTQHYISICLNKDKPALQCNGKCRLASEFRKQHATDEKITVSERNGEEPVHLIYSSMNISAPAPGTVKSNRYFFRAHLLERFGLPVFHPPLV